MNNDSIPVVSATNTLSPDGTRLEAFIDGTSVETKWIAGHHIVWQTGQQNGPDGAGPESHTHCSAFVAAVALDLDIYILRPPNHLQELLANAQMAWLGGGAYPGPTASASGWTALGFSRDAVALSRAVAAANAGKLVVSGYKQPPTTDPVTGKLVNRPGHIAIIRPQTAEISSQAGPLVTMAGDRNWLSIHMSAAFHSHPDAWPNNIGLFEHDTDLEMEFSVEAGVG